MIEAEPFDSSAFTSEVVREEHPGWRFQRFYQHTSESSHTHIVYRLYVTIQYNPLNTVELVRISCILPRKMIKIDFSILGMGGSPGRYDVLRRDHRQLIKMGEAYGDFDPLGKLAFLDQVEKIEERWDIFFGRLGLLGQLSPEYRQQSSDFLDTW